MKNHFSVDLKVVTLLLSAVVGAGAGVVATVLTSQAIDDYAASLLDDRRFTALAPQKAVSLPGTYEESLKALRDDASRSLAVIATGSVDSALSGQWITADARRGLGVVVSSDGWVLTTSAILPPSLDLSGLDVWVEKKRFTIERTVRDSSTPLVLMKLENASQLPTAGFGSAEDVESGDFLFLVDGERSLKPLALKESDREILFGSQKAETFTTGWVIGENVKSGLPLFASSGGLLGFTTGEATAFPLHHSRGFVQDTVRSGGVKSAGLGAYVADISRVYNITEEIKGGRNSGAVIIAPNLQTSGILKGGPADKAGLLVRDIIIDVDGEAVTSKQSLSEILSSYDPGEIANMRVIRAGQTLDVAVTLVELKDLVY
jgi:S1-C subfamily serine protease